MSFTEKGDEGQTTSTDPLDEEDADESADEVDGRHQRRQPNGLRRVVESGHLDDGGAVVPATLSNFSR